MAGDQISLFLCPPRWARKTTSSRGRTVHVVSASRQHNCGGPIVTVEDCSLWLRNRGLVEGTIDSLYPIFYGERIHSALGCRPNVEINVSRHEAEVSSLYCRFLLTRDAPDRLAYWQGLMEGLGTAFPFRIWLADGESVATTELLTVLRQGETWIHFANDFGWSG